MIRTFILSFLFLMVVEIIGYTCLNYKTYQVLDEIEGINARFDSMRSAQNDSILVAALRINAAVVKREKQKGVLWIEEGTAQIGKAKRRK